jgi:hypothetical protein
MEPGPVEVGAGSSSSDIRSGAAFTVTGQARRQRRGARVPLRRDGRRRPTAEGYDGGIRSPPGRAEVSMSESGGDMSQPHPGQRETRQHEAVTAADTPEHARDHARERVREGVTMALYISLSLLAVLVALPSSLDPGTAANPALTLFLTSTGLCLAHALAFRISTRLVHRGELPAADLQLLAAQVAGGLAVTVVAVTPVLLFGGPAGVRAAAWALLAFVAAVGYVAARSAAVSRPRALGYAALVVALALGVLWVKGLVHH